MNTLGDRATCSLALCVSATPVGTEPCTQEGRGRLGEEWVFDKSHSQEKKRMGYWSWGWWVGVTAVHGLWGRWHRDTHVPWHPVPWQGF